jgi:hypothetical protein
MILGRKIPLTVDLTNQATLSMCLGKQESEVEKMLVNNPNLDNDEGSTCVSK